MKPGRPRVLGLGIDPADSQSAVKKIVAWTANDESRVVCLANVHMVMEAWDNPDFRETVNSADLVVPDGMPLVWALRSMGVHAKHVRGADLTRVVCRQAESSHVPIGLYGSTPETLTAFRHFLSQEYSSLQIPFALSPPFRQLTDEEDGATAKAIRDSGARILLVGLGCPKQERWMVAHRDQIHCVMLGVGAAFDFLAGTTPQAPRWMRRCGLEWVFRLASDPRRLWKRYLKHNPRFMALFFLQWCRQFRGVA